VIRKGDENKFEVLTALMLWTLVFRDERDYPASDR
jgi:hypothetical protein